MNQPNSSIRCPHCNLLNFATDTFCKRCKNSLQNQNFAGDPNAVNININITTPGQPRFNISQNTAYPYNNQPPQQQNLGQPTQPLLNQPPRQTNNYESSEYQLQNQTGFEQWQQQNAQQNPPVNNQSYQQNYPMPVYPPNYYPANTSTAWRRGPELVMHRYAGHLPDCCVKCGQQISHYSGGSYIQQKYRWHNPLFYIALLSPLIYVILAAVVSQRVSVDIPLCQKHLEERSTTGKFLVGGGIAAVAAIFFFGSLGYGGFAFLIFLASLIAIVLGYEYSYKPLQISKIENDYIYLKKANHEFLSRLPNC